MRTYLNQMLRYHILCGMLMFTGCQSKYVTPEELNQFIITPGNGLTQQVLASGYMVNVTYRPSDLLIYQESDGLIIDSLALTSLKEKYSKYYYFILSLSRNGKEALHQLQEQSNQYSELVQTLSFRMNQHVSLTTASMDTIPVGDFILNRTYGVGSSTDLLFVFDKQKAQQSEWVQFNLHEFGLGIGTIRFRFLLGDLEGVPQLNFHTLRL